VSSVRALTKDGRKVTKTKRRETLNSEEMTKEGNVLSGREPAEKESKGLREGDELSSQSQRETKGQKNPGEKPRG